jgi:hypothetical protein
MKLFTKKLILTAVFAVFTPFALFANDYRVEDQPQVIEKALVLDNFGVLKQKENGYLYLDVTNEFISEIIPLIECEGRLVPPRHYTSKKGIGAHISVMYENERIDHEIWNVRELGHTYSFNVKELRTVKITRDGRMKKLWLLALEAPTLERLRENYGLSNKIKGHDMHITIGYQLPASQNPHADIELFIYFDEDLSDEEVFAEAA